MPAGSFVEYCRLVRRIVPNATVPNGLRRTVPKIRRIVPALAQIRRTVPAGSSNIAAPSCHKRIGIIRRTSRHYSMKAIKNARFY